MATPQKNFIVGIDIGTQMTRVLVTEESAPTPTQPRPKILALGYQESAGMRHGCVMNQKNASRSLADALHMVEKNTGIDMKRAYVAFGGASLSSELFSSMVTITHEQGEVTEDDITKLITIAEQTYLTTKRNKHILHAIPYKYRLDGYEVMGNPIGMRGSQLEMKVILITVLEHHFNDLVATVTDTGIDIINVIASPLAESVAVLTPKQKTVGCALVNIGHETTSLVVFDNSLPVSVHMLPVGSADITNDLALGLQIDLEEAEAVKMGHFEPRQYSKKKVEEIIEARMTDIFEMIQHHLRSIKRDGLLPAGLIITGGGSMIPHIEEHAKEFFKLPSTVRIPQEILNTKKDLDASWFVPYGLCFLEDDDRVFGTKIFKQAIKETKKGIMKLLREFLP